MRNALHSNVTFSRLAEKLDVLAVSSQVLQALTARTFGDGSLAPHKHVHGIKVTADLFETILGAYYLECGLEALYAWVVDLYRPLLHVGTQAFYDK